MPILKCSDKVPFNRRDTAGRCFKKGIAIGYRLAKNTFPPLNTLTLRELGKYASIYGIPRYSRMNKEQLIQALRDRNYPAGLNQ